MTQLRQSGTLCSHLITYMGGSVVIKKEESQLGWQDAKPL